jgi:uncharacterized lipoprotein YajG
MKKVLAILAVAGFMAACNNASETPAATDTAATTTVDTTAAAVDTTAAPAADTTATEPAAH